MAQPRNEAGQFETAYEPDIGDRICAEIIDGKSLRTICSEEGMPSRFTVMYWLRKFQEFKDNYDRACVERAEAYAEEIIDIADDGSNDFYKDEDGNVRVDKEHIMRSRLRVDTRKWICAKMKPRKYGEKVEISGEITQRDITDEPLTEQQWSEQYERLN